MTTYKCLKNQTVFPVGALGFLVCIGDKWLFQSCPATHQENGNPILTGFCGYLAGEEKSPVYAWGIGKVTRSYNNGTLYVQNLRAIQYPEATRLLGFPELMQGYTTP